MLTVITYRYRYLPLIVLILLAAGAWSCGLGEYISFTEIRQKQWIIEAYIQQHFISALLIYMTVYILMVAVSLPGAAAMTLVGGFFFDQIIGTVAAVCSATIGAMCIFLGVKLVATEWISK